MQKQKQNKKSSIKLLNLLLVLLLSFTAVMPQNLAAETTENKETIQAELCLLYTSPSPRDRQKSRMPSSA